jgi:hypothetical protein
MHQHKHKLEVLFDAAFELAPAEQARFLDRTTRLPRQS